MLHLSTLFTPLGGCLLVDAVMVALVVVEVKEWVEGIGALV